MTPEAAQFLARESDTKVLAMLGTPIDSFRTKLGLSYITMGSLAGIEMRKWWRPRLRSTSACWTCWGCERWSCWAGTPRPAC